MESKILIKAKIVDLTGDNVSVLRSVLHFICSVVVDTVNIRDRVYIVVDDVEAVTSI